MNKKARTPSLKKKQENKSDNGHRKNSKSQLTDLPR